MYRGEIVALVDGPTAEREEVGLLMATGRRDAEALAAAATSMTAAAEIEAKPVEAVAATVQEAAPPTADSAVPAADAAPTPEVPAGADAAPRPEDPPAEATPQDEATSQREDPE
jgi:hypothetical protein